MRVDFNEDIPGGVNVHLQQSSSVEGAVQQHHETLVRDVGPGRGDVSAVFGELLLVIITVQ